MFEKLLKVLALSLVGGAMNLIPAPFESQAIFAYGFSMSVLVALYTGWRFALLSVVIVAAPLLYQSLTIEVGLLMVQVLLIAHCCHGKAVSRPLIVTLLYWLVVGVPSLALYIHLMGQEIDLIEMGGILTSFINGLSVSLVGHFAFIAASILWPNKQLPVIKMGFLFRYFFTGLFYFATLLITFVYIGFFQKDQQAELDSYLFQRTRVVTEQLEQFIQSHKNGLTVMSNVIEDDPATAPERLTELAEHYPSFLTFLTTDANGDITHAFPSNLMNIIQQSGQVNVADRDYFKLPKNTWQSYVSSVFKGRGFGNEPIVAISAPMFNQQHEFIGVLEGSLDLSTFAIYDQREVNNAVSMIIADEEGVIVYASPSLKVTVLDHMSNVVCVTVDCDNSDERLMTHDEWIRVAQVSTEFGWTVFKFYPREEFNRSVALYIIIAIVTLLLLALVASFASYLVAKAFSQPLQVLIKNFAEFDPSQRSFSNIENNSRNYLSEISALDDGFNQLRTRLIQMFNEVNASHTTQEKLNKELRELNDSLELRVGEKTRSLEVALQEAQEASEAKSRFLANMSHEIRTPMNGIIGSCQNLQNAKLNPQERRKIDVIYQSAQALLVILNGILDWSKIEAGKMRLEHMPIDLKTLINQSFELIKPSALAKKLQVNCDINDTIPDLVKGDATKISQIINNLLNNAVKFTKQGSVTLHASYNAGVLQVVVTDTGIGIEEEQQKKVFEEFAQGDISTTRNFGGTGLGLAISLGLAHIMGGELTLKSAKGEGTKATLRIPLSLTNEKREQFSEDIFTLPEGLRILLAEDNEINAEILIAMLAQEEVKVVRVQDGMMAVDAVQHHNFDLVLMDCQMPVMDGFEATKAIRNLDSEKANIPIIALTANAYKEDRERCIDAGMNEHVAKPIDKKMLIRTIAIQLNRFAKSP